MGFSGGSEYKKSTCNVGYLGSIPGLERSSGGGHGSPLQYSFLENPHGQRSLVCYSKILFIKTDSRQFWPTHAPYFANS